MTREKVIMFCLRFDESLTEYGMGVYKNLVFIENDDLKMQLSSANIHGCYTLFGKKTRKEIVKEIVKEICTHYNII